MERSKLASIPGWGRFSVFRSVNLIGREHFGISPKKNNVGKRKEEEREKEREKRKEGA